MPLLKSSAARLYFAALYLSPPAFRREFSLEMARDVEEAIADARGRGGWRTLPAFAALIVTDLTRTLVVQWLRTGLPILFLLSAVAATTAVAVAGRVLPRALFPVPAPDVDRDLILLFVLIGGVLFIVATTILFSFWFSRPLLRRPPR
jgi:hypothetical protein